jgi:hypothetical protein
MTVGRYERLRAGMASPLISLNISGEKRGDISGFAPQPTKKAAPKRRRVCQLPLHGNIDKKTF